ncbi:alanine racemase [Solibacillus silvestris]|uniref:alanine racemase n=1 Tax=Solibacillus silvestris TaxID=76853 RepID=UPI003F81D947
MQQWEMNEMFTFPKQLGNVLANSKIVVEPKWHEETKDDSIVLRGIYVLKGNIQFDHVPREEEIEEGIYIEHMDIEKDHGYFEYALPFAIDFPNDDIGNISLRIKDVKIEPNNGCCLCSWHVHCDMEKNVQAIAEVSEKAEIAENAEVLEITENAEIVEMTEAAEPVQQPSIEEHIVLAEADLQAELQQETPPVQLVSEELDFLEQLADAYSRVQIQVKK